MHDDRAGAAFNVTRTHRYHLWRRWDAAKPSVLFVMLNPSTADEATLDPTIRRCLAYAEDWGYGCLHVANLFALRSTYPEALYRHVDPVGDGNDEWLMRLHREAALTVAAWGVHGAHQGRGRLVLDALQSVKPVMCLGVTKDGHPKHPLYLKATEQPRPIP